MISTLEIHWLAGLLEGEGYFGYGGTPIVTFVSTDEDVARRVSEMVNSTLYRYERRPGQLGTKPQYRVTVSSYRAASWMMIVHSLMGARRRRRITESLKAWKAAPRRYFRPYKKRAAITPPVAAATAGAGAAKE